MAESAWWVNQFFIYFFGGLGVFFAGVGVLYLDRQLTSSGVRWEGEGERPIGPGGVSTGV